MAAVASRSSQSRNAGSLQARATTRAPLRGPMLRLVGVDQHVQRGRVDVALLRQHRLQCAHAQVHLAEFAVLVVVVIVAHRQIVALTVAGHEGLADPCRRDGAEAPARARAAAGRRAHDSGGGRRPEGPGPESGWTASSSATGWRQPHRRCTCWARRSAPGAWPLRCLDRPGGGAGADWPRTTSTSDYEHAPGKAADAAPCQPGLRRQAERALRAPRGRGAGPPALPPACLHQPRPPCAAAPGPAAHAAGLHGRVPDQHRQPQGHGRLAGARGVLRSARAAAAAAARLSHAPGAADAANLRPAILASCSIPFWLEAVHDIPGAPRGAYWDGGITDYHLHLDYGSLAEGLVLYPHFQSTVMPGWLDKALKHRHRATAHLDNVVLLSPRPGVDRHAAQCQAARPQRLQGLRRRRWRPRGAPGAARWPRASAWRTSSRSARRLGPADRGARHWPETTIRSQSTHKDGKGIMVMTPRTTGFVTET